MGRASQESPYPSYRGLQSAASLLWTSPGDPDWRDKAERALEHAEEYYRQRCAGVPEEFDHAMGEVIRKTRDVLDAGTALWPDDLKYAIAFAAPLLRQAEADHGRPEPEPAAGDWRNRRDIGGHD